MLADPRSEALDRAISPASGSTCASWPTCRRRRRTSTTTCGRRSGARPRCSSRRIVREDRSIVDLLDADYTFVDERLARHYGIPNIHGSYFRRVPLDAGQPAPRPARAGQHADGDVGRDPHVAGVARQVDPRKPARHAGAGAAAGRRTNLEKDPEAVKADVAAAAAGSAPRATRCARRATRSWTRSGSRSRTSIWSGRGASATAATPIDSSGQLVDGTPLHGPADLRQALLSRSDAFVTTATEKLLTYALGRPVQLLRHADGARDRPRAAARTTTGSRRWCSASSRARRFR